MKLFLIQKEWADYCILDNLNNIISREKYKIDMRGYKLVDYNINLEIRNNLNNKQWHYYMIYIQPS